MDPSAQSFAETLITICRRVDAKGLVTATDGNISVRLPNGNVLTTPSGMNKGMVTSAHLVEVTMQGEIANGTLRPSTELKLHLAIYRHRPDINAVVHCHPIHATAFAAAGRPLTPNVFPEVIVMLGDVPLAPYGTPSTDELPDSIRPLIRDHQAILLENHGAVTCGADLWEACFLMEKVEQTAHILLLAESLGGARPLTVPQVQQLRTLANTVYRK